MNKDLLSYAISFVGFFFQNIDEESISNIKEVILFGSVARGGAGKGSDIDLFFNLYKESKKIEKIISRITSKFYDSVLFKKYWKLMGIDNEIKCVFGRLEKWKDLRPSIITNGIALYGKYTGFLKGKSNVVIYWERIKPESKRVLLSKKIYGYKYQGKRYRGLIEETNSLKLGSNCILVPLESIKRFLKMFKEMGIHVKTIYVSVSG